MKKSIFYLFLALVTLYSCKQSPEAFTITGDIQGLTDSYVYLSWKGADSTHTDSAAVTGGKFTFTGKAPNPEMATVYRADRKGYVSFFLENADIKLKGIADSLGDAAITGSSSNQVYEGYKASLQDINDQQEQVYKEYGAARKANDTALMKTLEAKIDELDDEAMAQRGTYIKQHPESFASLTALQRLVYGTPYKELNSLFTNLDPSVQNGVSGKKFAEKLAIMEKTSLGKTAPDFTQNNVNGDSVSLSDFRGKYVLVDFWASWCGPCRAENPNVVKAYNQYKDDGFTILGVSLDSDGEDWKKAIEADQLTWTHVSDLKGWKNEVAQQYGINAVPSNFLLNPDGVIIAHNLRGEDLEDKLAEVLN